MAIFDTLQPASFAGILFPVRAVDVAGGLRDHVHEFPHTPGGDPEILGRRLYTITMSSSFHTTFRAYPNLYPIGLRDLFRLFETGETKPLVVPTLGTIQAYCFDWSKSSEATVRSGESVKFTFRENEGRAVLSPDKPPAPYEAMGASVLKMAAVIDPNRPSLGERISGLFDKLRAAVNAVTGLRDRALAYRSLAASYIAFIGRIADDLDQTLALRRDLIGNEIKNELRNLQHSALAIKADLGLGKPSAPTEHGGATAVTSARLAQAQATGASASQTQSVDGIVLPSYGFDPHNPASRPPAFPVPSPGPTQTTTALAAGALTVAPASAAAPGVALVYNTQSPPGSAPAYALERTAPGARTTTAPYAPPEPPATTSALRYYQTPVLMAATDVAAAVFGDATRTSEILSLNDIEDPFSIPAHTMVVVPKV